MDPQEDVQFGIVPPTDAHVKTSGKEFAFGLIWDVQKELYMGLFSWGALGLQGERKIEQLSRFVFWKVATKSSSS